MNQLLNGDHYVSKREYRTSLGSYDGMILWFRVLSESGKVV